MICFDLLNNYKALGYSREHNTFSVLIGLAFWWETKTGKCSEGKLGRRRGRDRRQWYSEAGGGGEGLRLC